MARRPKPLPVEETQTVAQRLQDFLLKRLSEHGEQDALEEEEHPLITVQSARDSKDPLLKVVAYGLERAFWASGLARREQTRELWGGDSPESRGHREAYIQRRKASADRRARSGVCEESVRAMARWFDDRPRIEAQRILTELRPKLRRLRELLEEDATEAERRIREHISRVDVDACWGPARMAASLERGGDQLNQLLRSDPGPPDTPRTAGEWAEMLTEIAGLMLDNGAPPREVAELFATGSEVDALDEAEARILRNVRRWRKRSR